MAVAGRDYRRLTADNVGAFHRLATDPHVRRYLLDGEVVGEEWARDEIESSDSLFDVHGVGIWLVYEGDEPVGFIGYRVFEEVGPEPQLLYAFVERVTGRGAATAAARWLIEQVDWDEIVSAVDEPNVASMRVLEKVGFERSGTLPGAFGEIVLFTRSRSRR